MSDLANHFGGGAGGSFFAQLAGTLPLFGVMAGALFAGSMIERFGLRQMLLLSMFVFAVAGSAGVLLDAPYPFLGARLLMGGAAGVMTTACNSLIAIYYRGAKRARMNGLIIGAGAIAGISFVLIAGFTASWWWRAPFLLHAAVALAFLPAVLLAGRVPTLPKQTENMIGNLRRLRPIVPVCLVGFAWFAMMLMSGVQTPFVMALAGIGDHRTIATLYAINAASVSVSSVLAGRIALRFSSNTVLRASFLLLAAAMCILGSGTTVIQFAIGLMVSGVSVGFGLTAIWTWGMRVAPHDIVPRALGAMTTCLYLGGALSPFLSAPYEAMMGIRGQFFGIAATTALVVAASWIVTRKSGVLAAT
ncbi:MFS transporter (plasmid) [Sphingomonas paeninsulae]|uniref:MFS transporter n=1 Tax=Sphingomonas paeninsulae TaxID=2319844 RepID=A0A494T6X8_SPHPE|nr:MFS transporter [Sphingomonas paeninsulae]AYJ85087.1 MFS transporter [Sphingomonas paeninsulae]